MVTEPGRTGDSTPPTTPPASEQSDGNVDALTHEVITWYRSELVASQKGGKVGFDAVEEAIGKALRRVLPGVSSAGTVPLSQVGEAVRIELMKHWCGANTARSISEAVVEAIASVKASSEHEASS